MVALGSRLLLIALFGVALGDPRVDPPAGYADVVALIERSPRTGRPVQSVDELLPLLPRELRASFTLVHHSRSPGGGGPEAERAFSPAHPRLILSSRDARLLLALSGRPDRPGGDVVEALRFEPSRRAFVLSRFVLPQAVARDPKLAAEAAGNGDDNPAACLHCHGDDPRPIFDSYPLWPGFYGSRHDSFVEGSPELLAYRAFLASPARTRGIYRHLVWPPGTSTPPYLDPGARHPEAMTASPDTLAFSPNARLGMALADLNARRIQRRLEASPRYPVLRDALLAGLLGCAPLPVSAAELKATRVALEGEDRDRQLRLRWSDTGPTLATAPPATARIEELKLLRSAAEVRYVARALAIRADDWSLAFDDGALAGFDGVLVPPGERPAYLTEGLIRGMLSEAAAHDPALARFTAIEPAFAGEAVADRLDLPRARGACTRLGERARAAGVVLP